MPTHKTEASADFSGGLGIMRAQSIIQTAMPERPTTAVSGALPMEPSNKPAAKAMVT